MNTNYIFFFAVVIGIVAGLRAMICPATVSWAAYLGWLNLVKPALRLHGIERAVNLFDAGVW